MNTYTITSTVTGHSFGAYEGTTPEEAMIAMYRDAGYGQDVVWLDQDEIMVAEDHAELLDPSEIRASLVTVLTGWEAIAHARREGLTLSKYADPIEDDREGLTPDEAVEIAREDPALIWVQV